MLNQFVFDEPVYYKGLLFYPVKLKDYMNFLYFSQCLTLEKNSIKDPVIALKAISMKYFEYVCFLSNSEPDEKKKIIILFDALLRLCLNKKNEEFEIKYERDTRGNILPFFIIDDKKYDSGDFDEIRKIISEQNSLDLPDEKIQKEVRESLEEAQKWKQKRSGSKTASFEEQLVALSLFSGWDLEKVYNLTVRKFIMAIQRANHMIMSNIYLTASMSGFVTFKDKSILKGWLADIQVNDKYKDVTMSVDSLNNKLSSADAKKK